MSEIVIRELGPDVEEDYLGFFGQDAFSDNPDWSSCYCMFHHFLGSQEEWRRRTGEQNRVEKSGLIRSGEAHGLLAYLDGRPAGWCHAAPRAALPILDREYPVPDRAAVGAIVCFVVAPPFRRQGIATRLLDGACDLFRRWGLAYAEAYPRTEARSDAESYHGPMEMYELAGFAPAGEKGGVVIMRKALA